jgi:hypothetical protein
VEKKNISRKCLVDVASRDLPFASCDRRDSDATLTRQERSALRVVNSHFVCNSVLQKSRHE